LLCPRELISRSLCELIFLSTPQAQVSQLDPAHQVAGCAWSRDRRCPSPDLFFHSVSVLCCPSSVFYAVLILPALSPGFPGQARLKLSASSSRAGTRSPGHWPCFLAVVFGSTIGAASCRSSVQLGKHAARTQSSTQFSPQ
jgi:hypothetical protein